MVAYFGGPKKKQYSHIYTLHVIGNEKISINTTFTIYNIIINI